MQGAEHNGVSCQREQLFRRGKQHYKTLWVSNTLMPNPPVAS